MHVPIGRGLSATASSTPASAESALRAERINSWIATRSSIAIRYAAAVTRRSTSGTSMPAFRAARYGLRQRCNRSTPERHPIGLLERRGLRSGQAWPECLERGGQRAADAGPKATPGPLNPSATEALHDRISVFEPDEVAGLRVALACRNDHRLAGLRDLKYDEAQRRRGAIDDPRRDVRRLHDRLAAAARLRVTAVFILPRSRSAYDVDEWWRGVSVPSRRRTGCQRSGTNLHLSGRGCGQCVRRHRQDGSGRP